MDDLEQGFAFHHFLRVFKEHSQQAEFRRAQIARHPGGIDQQSGAGFHRPPSEAVARHGPRGRGAAVGRPPQQGADTGQQFARGKRLDDVVVGAQFQAYHPIRFLTQGAEKNNRNQRGGRVGPQPPTEGQPVLSGQHDIQQDKGATLARHGFHQTLGVVEAARGVAVGRQIVGNLSAQDAVVVHNEDQGRIAALRG